MKRRRKYHRVKEQQKQTHDGRMSRLAVLVLTVLMLFMIWWQRDMLEDYAKLGYLGIFVVNFLSSATVLLPLPGLATVILGGILWNPLLVGLVSGLGASMGEIFGYMVGYGGRGLLVKIERENHWLEKIEKAFSKHGFITAFIFSSLPFPVFDVIGMLAGALNYPIWKFFIATFLGRILRNTLFAWTGDKML